MNVRSIFQHLRFSRLGSSSTIFTRNIQKINLKAFFFSSVLTYNLYRYQFSHNKPHKCIMETSTGATFNFSTAAKSTVVIYKFNSDNPLAGGIILDESGLCITIGNIFPKESDERVDLDAFQVRILNEEKSYRIKLVEYFPDENLTLFRIVKSDPDIHFNACKLSTNAEIGSRTVVIGKSQENYNLIEEGIINEVALNAKLAFGRENDTNSFNIMANIKNVHTTLYGSPLLDQQGAVIGMMMPFDYKHLPNHVLATPAKYIEGILEQYKRTGKVKRPFLGMSVKTAAGGNGAFIIKLNSDGPAVQGGLKLGDTITEINDQKITSNVDFMKCVGYKLGDKLKLKVERDGKARTVFLEPV